jgi:aryl-alcohol dehydrogenase-like predicted oxidoreductase
VAISQLGWGTATLGGMFNSVSEVDDSGVIHTALDLGIDYIEPAPHYGKDVAGRRLGQISQ